MIRRVVLSWTGCLLLALLPAEAVGAEQLPVRKAGLWEIKMVRTGSPMPTITMQHCTDATVDREMNGVGSAMAQQSCSKQDIRKTAKGYATDSVCNIVGRTITSHSEVTGDFNSAYTVTTESQTKTEGSAAGSRNTTSTIEAKWLGACKPDQKPGDVMMPDGRKVNLIDLQQRKSPLPTR
jgi:hypothetical protein